MSAQVLGNGRTTSAEAFWYILCCIPLGAAYLAKVPVKKALSEYGQVDMTGAEKFWYVVQNIAFGSGYFSKVIIKKALSEVRANPAPAPPPSPRAEAGTAFSAPPLSAAPTDEPAALPEPEPAPNQDPQQLTTPATDDEAGHPQGKQSRGPFFLFTKKQRDEAFARVGHIRTEGMDPDRFDITVNDIRPNARGYMARRSAARSGAHYRVIVTDTRTGIPQYVAPAYTYEIAHRAGRVYVRKLCEGKKRLKTM